MAFPEFHNDLPQIPRGRPVSEGAARHPGLHCVPVESAKQLTEFIRVPRMIYGHMRNFVARLEAGERLALDPKQAPFFRHGSAQYWIARRDGQSVGRISAQIDRLQTSSYGLFGCLDAVDDPQVIGCLVDKAETWLRSRGFCTMRGPFSLSINGESGVLTEGHDAGAMVLMPWHPAYLADRLEEARFTPIKDLLAYTVDPSQTAGKLMDPLRAPRLPNSVRLRNLKMNDLESEARIIADLFNDAWHDNWGFVPLAVEEVIALARAFRIFLVPECGVILEERGIPVAMALILPNLDAMNADFEGTLLPFNWARLLYRALRKDYTSARLVLFGVARRLRGTLLGAAAPFAMIAEFVRCATKYRLSELEMSWVLEDNLAIRSIIERYGGRETKRYTVYQKAIAPDARTVVCAPAE
jgi:hypothetical protein